MNDLWRKLAGHFAPGEHNAYRPHLLRRPWLLFFLSVILTAESLYVVSFFAGQSALTLLSAVVPGDVIALTNVERQNVGDGSLAENALLDAAAQAKADDMAAKGYFSHVGPDGKEPWAWVIGAGYSYSYAGENLAVRFDNSSDVVNAWMASPTHKANIVKPQYTEIGVGVADGTYEGAPATFVVQYFGTPKAAKSAPSAPAPVREAPAPIAQSAAPEVAGASTENTAAVHTPTTTVPQASTPAPQNKAANEGASELRTEIQQFLRASDASQNTTQWLLAGIATLLVVVIALTVFVHIQIQPVEALLGGAFVGAVALSLFMLNTSIKTAQNASQSAAVGNAVSGPSILVDEGISTVAGGE